MRGDIRLSGAMRCATSDRPSVGSRLATIRQSGRHLVEATLHSTEPYLGPGESAHLRFGHLDTRPLEGVVTARLAVLLGHRDDGGHRTSAARFGLVAVHAVHSHGGWVRGILRFRRRSLAGRWSSGRSRRRSRDYQTGASPRPSFASLHVSAISSASVRSRSVGGDTPPRGPPARPISRRRASRRPAFRPRSYVRTCVRILHVFGRTGGTRPELP